jgi:branched-chain amino acid transport system substrate-binding protein
MLSCIGRRVASLVVASFLAVGPAARAEPPPLKIAAITTLGGADEPYGRALLDGVRLALEDANADGGRRIQLDVHDDGHKDDKARQIAERLVAGDAELVIGPLYSTSSLAAGPVFAKAGLASIVPEASSDLVTQSETTFRTTYKNSDVGDSLAVYLRHALGARHAAVMFVDNGYGHTIADGFKRGAERLGLPTTYHGFNDAAELDTAVRAIAADPVKPAVVLAMFDEDAAAVLKVLRRGGFHAPAVSTSGVSDEASVARFANEPEVRDDPGFFTRNFYSVEAVMLDSANARTLSFMENVDRRLPADRPDVPSSLVQAYDATRLAIAAVRQAAGTAPNGDVAARRAAVLKYLHSLDRPARGLPGLLGPIWFGPDRGRDLPMRVGVFRRGRLVSAPVQLVPVLRPDNDDIAAGAVLEVAPGHYARRQQVVYTGIYLNEVSRIDIAQSTFTADVYIWMRFARGIATEESDPTQIEFPGLVRGTFDSKRPVVHRDFDDGTTYRLWRVIGEFKDDFDLHGYPADSQRLNVRFQNARASSNRLVYVIDRGAADWGQEPLTGVAAGAFRNLTQWHAGKVL